MLDKDSQISVRRQCELLTLPRSSAYYRPRGKDEYNESLMRRLDEQYTKTPFYGVRKMTAWLRHEGERVNEKRVRRLLRSMGIDALYPKRRLSQAASGHRVFPYLLRGMKVERPDQVWSTDITYIRLKRGFVYLTAVMDWYSRYVVSWELSTNLESDFCIRALERALEHGQPEIFNSDQGCQFTSEAFTGRLLQREIRISMDGRGRAFDNIFVERLWRTVKYEEVYLKDYESIEQAEEHLARYFRFYNGERLHQALGYRTPASIYLGREEGSGTDGVFCVTPVGLRPPSVTQKTGNKTGAIHLNLA